MPDGHTRRPRGRVGRLRGALLRGGPGARRVRAQCRPLRSPRPCGGTRVRSESALSRSPRALCVSGRRRKACIQPGSMARARSKSARAAARSPLPNRPIPCAESPCQSAVEVFDGAPLLALVEQESTTCVRLRRLVCQPALRPRQMRIAPYLLCVAAVQPEAMAHGAPGVDHEPEQRPASEGRAALLLRPKIAQEGLLATLRAAGGVALCFS